MPIPERMRPVKVNNKKIKELAKKAEQILASIDGGASEEDPLLKEMMDNWNSQVACPYAFSDFRDFSSWTDAHEFTRIAFNLEKFYEDFTWDELLQTINFVRDPKSRESEQNFVLSLLEKNFHGNPSDLIFWPNYWFNKPDMLHVDLSTEEIAGYLMARSGRQLADAPQIDLKYPIPVTDSKECL
ncbi:hypothetical protein EDC48_101174 [Gibbsiella quercinecans]|uniref:Uncharacterized protein n=1 Tax=Gibbsiella quercinecans TaxID=929813 RepID=A0A250AVT0_9GAMM|nr:hypothetical protein [Gibbsiella quercinecans]ATA18047.1 hypothetical protein AWC35_01030 [Gibbsiella quercinecans]RLM02066.1 hypothetical protein BIY31_24490 [Gibbsiella quercinecans]RLM09549.1 hypothetical protein BIY30_11560 [Gibbsiella quercinecans]TCT92368.1 hypothetical protein EDC48_101174 [Gibbsiella quercinecans]